MTGVLEPASLYRAAASRAFAVYVFNKYDTFFVFFSCRCFIGLDTSEKKFRCLWLVRLVTVPWWLPVHPSQHGARRPQELV